MKNFVRLINELPFSGKCLTQLAVSTLCQTTTHAERTIVYVLSLLMLLAMFIAAHTLQAMLGVRVLFFEPPIWVRIVSILYIIANVCVVLVQAHLSLRITHFYLFAPYSNSKKSLPPYSVIQITTMAVVTLVGQLVFLYSTISYL